MRIVPFCQQPLEERCFQLHAGSVHSVAYPGEDSVVYRDRKTGNAIHVYLGNITFPSVITYAGFQNEVASSLDAAPYVERMVFQGLQYRVEVKANPVEEVGEKLFGDDKKTRAYTISKFIEAPSLCWPNGITVEKLPAIARQFTVLFYGRVSEWIEDHTKVLGIDINPMNTKCEFYEKECRISLMITDIAKSMGNIVMLNENN